MKKKLMLEKNFGLRLKTQLVIFFMGLMTLMMVAVIVITYRKTEAVLEEQSAALTQQYFEQNEYNLVTYAKEIDKILLSLSQISGVTEYLENGWEDSSDVILNLSEMLESSRKITGNYEEIQSVFFFGESGVAFSMTSARNDLYLEQEVPSVYQGSRIQKETTETPRRTYWTGGYTAADFGLTRNNGGEKDTTPYITVARSVNHNTRHVGTVIVNIRESKLNELMLLVGEKAGRKSFVLDESGKVIVDQESSSLGKTYDLAGLLESEEMGDMVIENTQINYRKIQGESGMDWMLVFTVPLSVLYEKVNDLRNLFAGTLLVALFAGLAAAGYFLYRVTRPLDQLRIAMKKMQRYDLGTRLEKQSRNELGQLGEQFDQMSRSIERMVSQIQNMEEEKKNLEENVLQAQINPHFLFNTLSNIKYMAMIVKSNTIVDCITALGNILSPIYRSDQKEWSAEEEISYLQNYIKIMNYRFGGRICVEYHVEQEHEKAKMLRFILQPMLENSITHGFEERGGAGHIWVNLKEADGLWNITVKDDGDGMTGEELEKLRRQVFEDEALEEKRRHIGLRNIYRRIQVYYGERYGMEITSEKGAGTNICMHFPTSIRTSMEMVMLESGEKRSDLKTSGKSDS